MSDTGAVPMQKLLELESGQHYIREQTDRDRRTQAERNMSFEDKIDDLRKVQGKQGEQLAGIVGSISTVKWMIATILPAAVGVAWALGRLLK